MSQPNVSKTVTLLFSLLVFFHRRNGFFTVFTALNPRYGIVVVVGCVFIALIVEIITTTELTVFYFE